MSPFVLTLAVLVVVVVAIWSLEHVIKRASYGATLVLIASVFDIAFATNKPAVFISGAKINLADFVFVLIVGAAIARLLRTRSTSTSQRILIALYALAFLSLVRGIPEFGLQTTVNEFRGHMRFLGAALYMSTFPLSFDLRNRVGRQWIMACVAVCVIAMLRWVESFTGLGIGPLSAEYGTVLRSISGTDTYFVAAGFLVSVVVWRRVFYDPRMRWVSAYLAVMVVLLNRRTVWLALMAGIAVMLFRDRTLGRRLVSVGAAAVGVTMLVLLALGGGASDDEELVKGATDTGNLAWRIEGWTGLLESWPASTTELVLGEPFGAGFEREVSDRTLESNPHSFYLENLLRLGIAGLACLVVLHALIARPLILAQKRPDGTYLGVDSLLVIVVSHMVWYMTWSPGYEQGILLGMAMSAAASATRTQAAGPSARVTTHALDRRARPAASRRADMSSGSLRGHQL